jgi:hypothetical protein
MNNTIRKKFSLIYFIVIACLRVPLLNFLLTQVRYIFFKLNPFRKLLIFNAKDNILRSDYSKSAFGKFRIKPLTRSSIPYQLASVLNWPNISDKKMLIIGPRYESDIFFALGYGFKKNNIYAVDLFSYSKLISIGDAHNLLFESSFFDIVILPWMIIYSDDQDRVCTESIRVLKTSGQLCIFGDHTITGQEAGVEDYNFDIKYIETLLKSRNLQPIILFSNGELGSFESGPVIYVGEKCG